MLLKEKPPITKKYKWIIDIFTKAGAVYTLK
jgi:hypothetical protein